MRVRRNCCGLDQVGFATPLSFFHPLQHAGFIPALSELLTICPESQNESHYIILCIPFTLL